MARWRHRSLAPDAIGVLGEVKADTSNIRLRVKAATEILDRGGFPKVQKF